MAAHRNSARMDARGRISIPHAIRAHLALQPGDHVLFRTLPTGEVIMESRDQVKARILRAASPTDIDTNTRDVPAILEALGTDITTALVALRRVRGAYERLEDLLYTGALDVSEDAQYARYFAWGSVISSLEKDAQRLREAFDTTTTTDGTPS